MYRDCEQFVCNATMNYEATKFKTDALSARIFLIRREFAGNTRFINHGITGKFQANLSYTRVNASLYETNKEMHHGCE